MKKNKKDLILSFFLPRKMYRHHNMRFIFSLGIFFGATLILLFSINISTPRFMRKMINTPDFTKNVYEYVETKEEFPDYKIDNIGGELCLDCNETGISEGNTYRKAIHNILKEKNSSKRIDLTVVFLEDYDPFKDDEGNFHLQNSAFKDVFDLDGYLRQDKEENVEYILYVFTKTSFYYAYNLESGNKANSVLPMYEYDTTTFEINYYLPDLNNENEFRKNEYGKWDVSLWTRKVSKDETLEYEGNILSASPKLLPTIREVLVHSEYLYKNIDYTVINDESEQANFKTNENVNEALSQLVELMVLSDANVQKSIYSLFVCVINLIFPFLWVFITWLMSKKFVMSKFREYYAICSITYLVTSLIGFILGFFLSFDKLILILLVMELIYYIVVTFRINTDPKLLEPVEDENDKDNSNKPDIPGIKKQKLNFKKIETEDTYHIE